MRRPYSLDDRYLPESSDAYLTGNQALVRLLIEQRAADRGRGLRTAGFVSGYRGSPLGGLDQQLRRARVHLEREDIRFQPGVNEELAATAAWGTQQLGALTPTRFDGVFALWYGKGPGVDRSGDAFKHANAAGTAALGGVLAIAGDDHGCKSSTLAHQSEFAFVDAMIPVLHPCDLDDLIRLGLLGWAMSRFSGCWVALKASADLLESAANVSAARFRVVPRLPADQVLPADGLSLRWPDAALAQEARLHEHKLPAARAFARANALDGPAFGARRPRLGIVTTGKAYQDVRQALADLGLDEAQAEAAALGVYRVAMPWPLDSAALRDFARDAVELLAVEEKRALIEPQIRDGLFGLVRAPLVVGKHDEHGRPLLPATSELSAVLVAEVIAGRLRQFHANPAVEQRVAVLRRRTTALAGITPAISRSPHFCSGCPHNTSTLVPEGSRALGGIGCHTMAVWRDPRTVAFTQMGGEGATWIGQAPFADLPHVFQNMGDGTYFHSGLLAVRAAVAAGVNITFKVLYNDAVAMTGGQPMDGPLTVADLTRQLESEGVRRIAVVTDDPARHRKRAGFAPGATVHHRSEMDTLQRQLRAVAGVTALIYDQACAAELRRRRRRRTAPERTRRVFINPDVCDNCGDCSAVSGCLSIVPVDTPLGRKRRIDQGSCNTDYRCLEGFCPSFVTVDGGRLRPPPAPAPMAALPAPPAPAPLEEYNILIAGIGGTGVVTLSALLGTAAHLEGRSVRVLDQTGLAQKFGAVVSHLRIAPAETPPHGARIPVGATDLLIACDLVTAAGPDILLALDSSRTRAVLDTSVDMPSQFLADRDFRVPVEAMTGLLRERCLPGQLHGLAATAGAALITREGAGANIFLLGFAWQLGLMPLREDSILRAVELNGVAVEANRRAFAAGRRAALEPPRAPPPAANGDTEALIAHRTSFLAAYQDDAYAQRYRRQLDLLRAGLAGLAAGASEELVRAAADNLFRAMAIKDEYEVARLYTRTNFLDSVSAQVEGTGRRLRFHLAPPIPGLRAGADGRPRKLEFGPWVLWPMKVLASLRRLRGSLLDPFRHQDERRAERRFLRDYEADLQWVAGNVTAANAARCRSLLELPAGVRGFGPVKAVALAATMARRDTLRRALADNT
jgi:indolepyruvate ferredoxin oxidoreductase